IPFQIVIWQVQTGKEVQRLAVREEDGRPSRLACLAFSADSRTLITGQRGETALRLWEVASGQERGRFEGHVDSVLALAVSPDGKKLASGSEDGTVLIWDLEGSTQEKPAYQPNLTVRQLASLWTDLAGQDGARAREAILKFTHAPRQSVPFLKEHLPPVRSIRTEQMGRWLADLDSPRFAARAEATRALEDLQEAAEPGLHRVLREDPSPEVRGRVEQLLQELHQLVPSGERLQALRAVETLEHIATPEARQVLEQVASGLPEARLTQEARAALKRLREP
ncbi:MAG: hypothetical protein JO112_21150, partial [Planctomycetes bacterium]|nr:hypothetical protein [Planctomycetota bacterium]